MATKIANSPLKLVENVLPAKASFIWNIPITMRFTGMDTGCSTTRNRLSGWEQWLQVVLKYTVRPLKGGISIKKQKVIGICNNLSTKIAKRIFFETCFWKLLKNPFFKFY